ncbi:MAG: hypothetical protein K2X39_06590, partial [Silvanigrellaceae bacterium]|nr:hypothetical protein [Silvanigrellaceae bacterium]
MKHNLKQVVNIFLITIAAWYLLSSCSNGSSKSSQEKENNTPESGLNNSVSKWELFANYMGISEHYNHTSAIMPHRFQDESFRKSVEQSIVQDSPKSICSKIISFSRITNEIPLHPNKETGLVHTPNFDLYLLQYQLGNDESTNTIRYGLVTVPKGNKNYPLLVYGHGNDQGIKYSELTAAVSSLMDYHIVAAPSFTAQGVVLDDPNDLQPSRTLAISNSQRSYLYEDGLEMLGIQSCLTNISYHQGLFKETSFKINEDEFTDEKVTEERELIKQEFIQTLASQKLFPHISEEIFDHFFFIEETQTKVPQKIKNSRGKKIVEQKAHSKFDLKVKSKFKVYKDKEDNFLPAYTPKTIFYGSDIGGTIALLAAEYDGVFFNYKMPTHHISILAANFPLITFYKDSFLKILEKGVDGKIDGFTLLPGAKSLNFLFKEFRESAVDSPLEKQEIERLAILVSKMDVTYGSRYMNTGLQNWQALSYPKNSKRKVSSFKLSDFTLKFDDNKDFITDYFNIPSSSKAALAIFHNVEDVVIPFRQSEYALDQLSHFSEP